MGLDRGGVLRVGAVLCVLAFSSLTQGQQRQPLSSPVRVALDPEGRVFVSEFSQRRVLLLDGVTLDVVDEIPIRGQPVGIAWAGNRLLVGNATTGNVETYARRRGEWKRRGRFRGGKSPAPTPNDIAVDLNSRLVFVASPSEKAVLVFGLRGRPVGRIGALGDPTERLHGPTAVAVDAFAQEILVSDYGDPAASIPAAVKIYDYAGDYLGQICGESGQPGFQFSRPQGLAIDDDRHVFLAESLLGEVLVFDRDTLAGVKRLGGYGAGPGKLRLPLDVLVDGESADVLVTSNRSGRIEVFRRGGVMP